MKNIICATLCYIEKNEKILMVHRVKKKNDIHQDKWNGLGGKFEIGESPEECLLREIKEESGLTLTSYNLSGMLTFPLFDGKNDWYCYLYHATEFDGNLIECNEGNLEWVPKEKIFDLNIWEGDKLFIKWMFDEKFFSAKFNYHKKKLIDYSVKFYN